MSLLLFLIISAQGTNLNTHGNALLTSPQQFRDETLSLLFHDLKFCRTVYSWLNVPTRKLYLSYLAAIPKEILFVTLSDSIESS